MRNRFIVAIFALSFAVWACTARQEPATDATSADPTGRDIPVSEVVTTESEKDLRGV